MRVRDGECVAHGVTLFLEAEATNVPGQHDVIEALLIHLAKNTTGDEVVHELVVMR